MKRSLLDRARSERRFRGAAPTKDEVDLCLAILNGEVSSAQAAAARGVDGRNILAWSGSVLMRAHRFGLITIRRK